MAKERFEKWVEDTFEQKLKTLYTRENALKAHFANILNFFNNRNTNTNTESFHAKIKLFRANSIEATDLTFFSLDYINH